MPLTNENPRLNDDLSLTARVAMPEQTAAMITRYGRALAMAEATVIESAEDAGRVAGDIRTLKLRRTELEAQRDFTLQPAATLVERVKALFSPALTAIESADKILRGKLIAWNDAEATRVRRERAEAEERQRAERQRAEAAAAEERRRAYAEAQALRDKAAAQQAAGDLESAAKTGEESRHVIETGEAIAAAREMEASASVAVVERAAVPKGTGGRDNWRAEIVAETEQHAVREILSAIMAGRSDLIGLLMISGPAANAMARATKDSFNVPGMRAVNNRTTVVR